MKNRNITMRILAFLLLTSMLVSSLAACNGVTITPNPVETTTTTTEKNDPDPNPDPDPKPHTCVFGHWEVVKAATTTEEGLRERRCECGEIEQEVIPCPEAEYSITYNNLKTADYPEVNGYNSADGLMNLPRPEATGYVFVGWYTSSVGGDIVDYIPKGSTKDYILFAHWELVEYTITYKNAPNYSGIMSYDIEDKLRLVSPKWSGLEFDYWSDEEGNKYYPDDDITTLPTYTHGDLVLTANWKVLRNIATPSAENSEMFYDFSSEDGYLYFFYDLGTIEHVILDHPDNLSARLYYKAEGTPISFTLSKTVTIGEETARSISNTVSQSISSSTTTEESMNVAKTQSTNWSKSKNTSTGGEIGGEYQFPGGSKITGKVQNSVDKSSSVGGESGTSIGWGRSVSSTVEVGFDESRTVSSSLSYKEEISSEISETIGIDANQPSGYYTYVHAGNIRVFAVVIYEIETGYLYINTHSRLDNMHSMVMYYPDVNSLNNPTIESLGFTIPAEEIINMVESSYYVSYDSNGGEGTMPTTMHSINENDPIAYNEFKKAGHEFAGWEMTTSDGEKKLVENGADIRDLVKPLDTITLKALWTSVEPVWVVKDTGSFYFANFPSTFDTNHELYKTMEKSAYTSYENDTTKRVITVEKAGYVYWHWMYDTSASGTSTRAIYHKKGTGPDNGYYYKYFFAFTSTKGDYPSSYYYCNSQNKLNYIVNDQMTSNEECGGATRWFRFEYYICTYTDYELAQ